jgi:4'-phosphopantetheinyl transferase
MRVPSVSVRYRHTASTSEREQREALSILSPDERDRYGRFVFAEDRRDFALAHALLRRTLASTGSLPAHQWRLEAIDGKKPRVVDAPAVDTDLSFNLTHTRGLVACAVSRGVDVGIDVERVRDQDAALIAKSCFAPIERECLAATPETELAARFIEIWTLKEAWLKATGVGLTAGLDTFAFSVEASTVVFHPPAGVRAEDWRFALIELSDGFRLAVAVRCNGETTMDIPVEDDANGHQPLLRAHSRSR